MDIPEMASRSGTDTTDGYIIKLYKKIPNAPKKATIREAMFMTWTNFDCMDVLPVSGYQGFSKSLGSDLKEQEKYNIRQKLFLYPVSPEQHLLSNDNSELESYPLFTLTVLDLEKPSGMDLVSYRNKLCQCLEDCLREESSIKGQVYGCLSIYDHALVMRGKSYTKLVHVLAAYCRKLIENNVGIRKTYTIPGLDLKHCSAWQETSSLTVSVRLSCTSQVTAGALTQNSSITDALTLKYPIFSVLGKYDYDIIGEVRDTTKFVALFLDSGALSPATKGIHKTNTRFLLQEDWASSSELNFPDTETAEAELNDFIRRSEELNSLCPSIRESLLRLILRLFQTSASISDDGMRKNLKETLDRFLDFLSIHQTESDQQDSFAQMINCLNLLLDNRVTAGMSDFETPQNVLRYSGANLKVLLAYGAYVENLFFILQSYKDLNKEPLHYVPLVTTDTGAKITATIYLSSCPRYRFININIPVDLLFEVQNVLPWLTHEVGHFIRAGWSREKRNAAYFWSMSRAASKMLDLYIAEEYMPSDNPTAMENFLAVPVPEDQKGTKFDQYRDFVCQYYQSILLRCTYDYNARLQLPQSHTGTLLSALEEIADILQKVYEEAIADIFMIRVLGIDNLNEYLRIQHAYYEHINQSSGNLPLANVSRIIAVSIIIKKWNPADYENIYDNFSRLYEESGGGRMEPLLNQLKSYEDYYLIEPLVIFLRQTVESGLEQLLQRTGISDVCGWLRKQYKNLRTENFDAFLDFINLEK